MPCRAARPLRGTTNPAHPSGIARAMPVGTAARPPRGARTRPSRATRSAPASPARAYEGSGRSGSSTCTGTSSRSATRRTYAAPMLVWLDLEMTGLDPERHVIVEVATLVTDDELAIVATGPDLVIQASAEAMAQMDDFVREMHTKSGLLPQIEQSTITLEDAAAQTLEFVKSH